jgi:hypothetical protein
MKQKLINLLNIQNIIAILLISAYIALNFMKIEPPTEFVALISLIGGYMYRKKAENYDINK